MNKLIYGLAIVLLIGLVAGTITVLAPSACSDRTDNDGDGAIDYPNDPGCSSKNDFSELDPNVACDDGVDNDGDGATDLADPGCASLTDTSEYGTAQCDNGVDDADADTVADYPADAGCSSLTDNSEVNGYCDDGINNDGDSAIDYPSDPECTGYSDAYETNCVDSDGGFTPATSGTATGSTGGVPYSLTDFCLDGAILIEHYCYPWSEPSSANVSCTGNFTGCSNGACI